MRAAVPHYMRDLHHAPPGHRFSLYFPIWNDRWELANNQKSDAAKKIATASITPVLMEGLLKRQQVLAGVLSDDDVFGSVAESTAPFVTGMGYEHPLENGFAFLNPYGLPYLPGASVKGVLRRAAEELVLAHEAKGFDMLDVWRLFGFDGNAALLGDARLPSLFRDVERLAAWLDRVLPNRFKEEGLGEPQAFLEALPKNGALRRSLFNKGALNFWDVFPQGRLTVEIMTPHHSAYLQQGGAPHDSEKPNPIPFLAVDTGAKFHFFIQRIGDSGDADWRNIVRQCLAHAWDWLGFGAKTAVGYGAMERDADAEKQAEAARRRLKAEREKARAAREEEKRRAAMSPLQRELEPILARGSTAIGELLQGLKSGRWSGDDAVVVAQELKKLMEQNGSWLPSFSGKNKQKRKKYERTLEVMRFLEGESS